MKILHVIPNLNQGGAERLVIDTIRQLKTNFEIEVKLLIFRDEIEYDIEDIKASVFIIPTIVKLSVWKKNNYLIEELEKFIESFNPDVIHTHLFEAEIAVRIKPIQNCAYFSHAHWNTKELSKPKIKDLFSRNGIIRTYEYYFILNLYKKCNNKFITISKHTDRYYKKNLPTFFHDICYYQNAIQLNKFATNSRRTLNNGNLLKLVSVGTLNNRKNQHFQIEIAQELNQIGIDFTLKIIGDGPYFVELKEHIINFNLQEKVILVGKTNHVEKFLEESDIFLHTAHYEPFGLVLIEAMASGLPIITFNGGGNEEIIQNGVNGFLMNKLDKNMFSTKIIELFGNKNEYNQISKNALNTAKNYDIAPYVENLIKLYTSQNEQIQ
jgi:glycosyltransferase involved in cell wall biosynthesis